MYVLVVGNIYIHKIVMNQYALLVIKILENALIYSSFQIASEQYYRM